MLLGIEGGLGFEDICEVFDERLDRALERSCELSSWT